MSISSILSDYILEETELVLNQKSRNNNTILE